MLVQGSFCRKQKLCFLCGVLIVVEIPKALFGLGRGCVRI